MFTFFRIFTYTILLMLPALQLLRDWRYSDKRTFKHHRITKIILSTWFIFGLISSVLYLHEAREKDSLTKQLTSLSLGNQSLLDQNQVLISQSDSLLKGYDEIYSRLEPFIRIATKLFPEYKQNTALEKLQNKMTIFESELKIEKNTIRDLKASVSINFSGDWVGGVGIVTYFADQEYLTISSTKNENLVPIKFYTTKPYVLEDLDNNHALFSCEQAVHVGEYPLGKTTNELLNYDSIEFFLPFTQHKFRKKKILAEKINIIFFVNGIKKGEIYTKTPFEFDIKRSSGEQWAGIEIKLLNKVSLSTLVTSGLVAVY